jgi:hypothetical protein
MAALLIGDARCSTDQRDLTAEQEGLIRLGIPARVVDVLTVDGMGRRWPRHGRCAQSRR